MILTIRLLLPFNISFANNVVRIPLPDSSKISTVFQDIPSNSIQIDMSGISHPVQQAASLNHIPSLMDILTWLWFSGFVLFCFIILPVTTFSENSLFVGVILF